MHRLLINSAIEKTLFQYHSIHSSLEWHSIYMSYLIFHCFVFPHQGTELYLCSFGQNTGSLVPPPSLSVAESYGLNSGRRGYSLTEPHPFFVVPDYWSWDYLYHCCSFRSPHLEVFVWMSSGNLQGGRGQNYIVTVTLF